MPTHFDLSVFSFIHGVAPGLLAPFETGAANWLIVLVPFVLIALWLRDDRSDHTVSITAVIAAGTALAMSGLISFLVFEPRPFTIGLAGNVLDHAADSSFPSDHVAVMTAVATSLAFAGRSRLAAILATATVLVGWSRVALGVHFPTDIIAGALIGICASTLLRSGLSSPFVAFVVRVGEAVSALIGVDRISDLIRKPSSLGSD